MSTIIVRLATPLDHQKLETLAALDSARAPDGATLIAELDDRPVAALSLADGAAVADPFVPTSEVVDLLRLRADQLRPRLAPRGRGF